MITEWILLLTPNVSWFYEIQCCDLDTKNRIPALLFSCKLVHRIGCVVFINCWKIRVLGTCSLEGVEWGIKFFLNYELFSLVPEGFSFLVYDYGVGLFFNYWVFKFWWIIFASSSSIIRVKALAAFDELLFNIWEAIFSNFDEIIIKKRFLLY